MTCDTFCRNYRLVVEDIQNRLDEPNTISDDQIVAGCKANDLEMQKMFYIRFGPYIMGVCSRYLKPRETAEEVFHDSLLKIFDNIHKFSEKGSLKAWCRRVTVNLCLDYIRKYKNKVRLNYIEEEHIEPVDADEDTDLLYNRKIEEVMACIDELPEQQQLVLNMFIMEGFSHKTIAEKLVITEGASRSLMARAKRNLKKKLAGAQAVDNESNGAEK